MKRFVSVFAALVIAISAFAIPAKRGFNPYTQPGGKTLVLEQVGDEFGSWFRDKSGNRYRMDGNGFFHPLTETQVKSIAREASVRRMARSNERSSGNKDMAHGSRHILVVLVEFSDVKFKINSPAQNIDALLNEEGYNGYDGAGATGSVRDFYMDNSHGAFEPIFDVFGPVTLNNPIKYYGEQMLNTDGTVKSQDKQPELALYDACLQLDNSVDFSKFDYNDDGYVDLILFYYAGGSQAEGWPTDHLWPHSWSIQYSSNREARNHSFDGKKLADYICSAELKGTKLYNNLCSIGVTCHEFGHSLGLPDFYDADYEENGEAGGLYEFSTMSSGAYNDDSRTPPYFNVEERIMLGWMDESGIKDVGMGENVIPFADENAALRTWASARGEYFLYEKRGGKDNKWDSALPEGMAVYHVDKSPDHTVIGGITAETIWLSNSINNYAVHPCFMLVPPRDQQNTNYTSTRFDYSDLVFPGYYDISSYCPVDWDGLESGPVLTDIRVEGNRVLFSAQGGTDSRRYLDGMVWDTSGKPLEGVSISLNASEDAAVSGTGIIIRKLSTRGARQAVTDSGGRFSFEIGPEDPSAYTVSAALDGYVSQSVKVTVTGRFNAVEFTLRAQGEFGVTEKIPFYDVDCEHMFGVQSPDGTSSVMTAAKCLRSIWGAYEGLHIKEVSYLTYFKADAYYFILDSETGISAVKCSDITANGFSTFDISNKGIRIPSGDFYIGFGVQKAEPNEYDAVSVVYEGFGCYHSPLSLSGHATWHYDSGYDIPLVITLLDDDYTIGLPDIGYPYIDIAEGALRSGDKVTLSIATSPDLSIKAITWTYDGVSFPDGSEVELDAGWHGVSAAITFSDGSKTVLEREIEVK